MTPKGFIVAFADKVNRLKSSDFLHGYLTFF